MKKVITYGTYDLLHQGHINLLRRARELGDYLVVGVTSDSFDRERGKLSVQGDVLERVAAVKATGLADEIIIEDYVGQKIDDIQNLDIDVFAIGSDWEGRFDYLREYCEVVYLPRTEGISSTLLRSASQRRVRVGVVGAGRVAHRFVPEASFVNGVEAAAVFDTAPARAAAYAERHQVAAAASMQELLERTEAVYVATPHLTHAPLIRQALEAGKHVLCETPMTLRADEAEELFSLAHRRKLVLMEANKTAHCPAFRHLIVMIKSGVIGQVVDIEASLSKLLPDRTLREFDPAQAGGSMYELGSYPLLPILKLLGTDWTRLSLYSRMEQGVDVYTKGVLCYPHAVASFKLGLGVKTEGNLVISGTRGYALVPSPWWKTDFFELRYEDQNENKKFFYKWDGAGLRYEIREFIAGIVSGHPAASRLTERESVAMARIMQQFTERNNFLEI